MSKLFSPLQVKNLSFANRIVLPPMAGDRAEPDGTISDGLIAYYRQMAGCGMGLLIIEHNFIDPDGKVSARQISPSPATRTLPVTTDFWPACRCRGRLSPCRSTIRAASASRLSTRDWAPALSPTRSAVSPPRR